MLGDTGKAQRKGRAAIGRGPRPTRGPEQDHRRHEGKRDQQRDADAQGHHPAEVDHGLNTRNDQRHKRHHGGDGGIETGHGHQPHRVANPLVGRVLGRQAVEFAVAHHQVDGDCQTDDQQHRNHVGGNHGHAPVEKSEHTQGVRHAEDTTHKGDDDPLQTPKNHREHQHHHAENRAAEGQQITAHEAQHIGGDHRHTADKEPGVIPIPRHDLTNFGDQRAVRLKLRRAAAFYLGFHAGQTPRLGGIQGAAPRRAAQLVALAQHRDARIVAL